ncbi:UNVERIFIED_ORG: hypothetical protein GGI66_003596 [Rhizobium esperanzae]
MNVLIAYLLFSALAAWFCCALSGRCRREEEAPAALRLVSNRAPRRAGRR